MNSKVLSCLFPTGAIVALAAGCTNLYVANYRPVPEVQSSAVSAQTSRKPRVIVTAHIKAETMLTEREGYTIIGISSFAATDRRVTPSQRAEAEKQAEAVGADVVILKDGTKVIGKMAVAEDIPNERGYGVTTEDHLVDEFKCSAVYLRKISP